MKKPILPLLLATFTFCTMALYSEKGKVLYVEGKVTIRNSVGVMHDAEIDDQVDTGFTIATGKSGYAEIDKSGSLITLEANTVFQFLESERKGKKADVFSAVSGAVLLKIKKLTDDDTSPSITSPSATLGVRGTAFTVYAGLDGASVVAVEEGGVEVEANGVTILLAANEGVEVRPGQAPGAKFEVLRGKIDFADWSEKNLSVFLADPVAAVKRVGERLDFFSGKLQENKGEYDKNFEILKKMRDELATYTEKAKKQEFYDSTVFPQEILTSGLYLNVRYYALSSLSMRRYVVGRMYVNIKSGYMNELSDALFTDFLAEYNKVREMFETEIIPFLVDADI
jgi:hypothetical protein